MKHISGNAKSAHMKIKIATDYTINMWIFIFTFFFILELIIHATLLIIHVFDVNYLMCLSRHDFQLQRVHSFASVMFICVETNFN